MIRIPAPLGLRHQKRRRHRRHNLSTCIIILTRVLSASSSTSSSATQSFTKRRCTTKTQPPEGIDLEPPDLTQGPSQASQGGTEDLPDVKTLIAQSDRAAALAKEAFWRKSVSTQRKRKQFLLIHHVNANCFSQKLLHSGPYGTRFARPC